MENKGKPVYLDNNATTMVLSQVREAMAPYLEDMGYNPSAGYVLGQQVRRGIDKARVQVAELINCTPDDITFTSCATESCNTAILGNALHAPKNSRFGCLET